MRIFSKAIASGKEWKPCIECEKPFFCGEIISSLTEYADAAHVHSWFCSSCTARFLGEAFPEKSDGKESPKKKSGKLLTIKGGAICELVENKPYIDHDYLWRRIDRLVEVKKFSNCDKYMPYYQIRSWSLN